MSAETSKNPWKPRKDSPLYALMVDREATELRKRHIDAAAAQDVALTAFITELADQAKAVERGVVPEPSPDGRMTQAEKDLARKSAANFGAYIDTQLSVEAAAEAYKEHGERYQEVALIEAKAADKDINHAPNSSLQPPQ